MTVRPPSLRPSIFVLAVLLVFTVAPNRAPAAVLDHVLALPRAALLVEVAGRPVIAHQADRPMIPASTMKLVTALAAIDRWGLDHHFTTDLYLADDGWLWVKAAGDPLLVSEELDLLARALYRAGVRRLAGIGIDDRLYASDLRIPGRSGTDNPYDAPITAFAVNFNTLHLRVSNGRLTSAEAQTPLTPLARALGGGLGAGEHRINVQSRELALRYAGELLAAKLAAAGIEVGAGQVVGVLPGDTRPVLSYRNSRDLRAVLEAMLKYSSNLIANELFLLLAVEGDAGAVDIRRAQRAMMRRVRERFGWHDFRIEDGAGLSRDNRLSARQLVAVLEAFTPYRALLPVQPDNPAVRAKTGTLTGVSTYAGYVQRDGRWVPFALLINQAVAPALRRQLADELARTADLEILCTGGRC
ncbi:D-alanyl-D-alanine carboxypeptidase (penicillin-binding protein 4) [Thioflavicoccus mobilis 8321]|uniref:D-alanyl-D-alanine carboxypeptidase (Penicillin-binding protein 4) n=1 Tax=Thioflavicoccus mobilis 8321 TaxID=765912 RepID=L0GX45_9GAMM|nr:D-alanyl-D-alanine carboxypeptidase [Thioflavicoccus mobilis]AGA89879.1 D-alanyl-D-alanine carboxypeptidase (penicillin-binding protein 4) [Thioflavicoccus mobilis 8321]